MTAPRGVISDELRDRISARKAELVAWLAAGQADGNPRQEPPTIVPGPDRPDEPFPPSDMQASFLIGATEGFEYYVRPHQYLEITSTSSPPGGSSGR